MTTTQITYHVPKTMKLVEVRKGWKILFRNGDVGTVQNVREGSVDLTVRTKRGAVKVQTLFISTHAQYVEVIAS